MLPMARFWNSLTLIHHRQTDSALPYYRSFVPSIFSRILAAALFSMNGSLAARGYLTDKSSILFRLSIFILREASAEPAGAQILKRKQLHYTVKMDRFAFFHR